MGLIVSLSAASQSQTPGHIPICVSGQWHPFESFPSPPHLLKSHAALTRVWLSCQTLGSGLLPSLFHTTTIRKKLTTEACSNRPWPMGSYLPQLSLKGVQRDPRHSEGCRPVEGINSVCQLATIP